MAEFYPSRFICAITFPPGLAMPVSAAGPQGNSLANQLRTRTMPDTGNRHVSAMIVKEAHYIDKVFCHGGTYGLSVIEFDTPFVLVALRAPGGCQRSRGCEGW